MDSVALFLCIVRYFVGEEILLESASFVYSFIVVIKQKTRPGSLFYGKRGGFCCCKYREYILNYKTFFKKNFAHISSSIQNDTLFAIKRYVIFSKTSRRFQQNDTLFFESFALTRYKHRLASRAPEMDLTTLMQGDENELFQNEKRETTRSKREAKALWTREKLCFDN